MHQKPTNGPCFPFHADANALNEMLCDVSVVAAAGMLEVMVLGLAKVFGGFVPQRLHLSLSSCYSTVRYSTPPNY